MSHRLRAGSGEVDWTPEPGLPLFGQMHKRTGEYVRDPLTANAAAFQQDDDPPVVLVSVDVCVLDASFVHAAQALFAERTGAPPERLLIHATHTHVAPSTVNLMAGVVTEEFRAHLREAVVRSAELALARLEPVTLFGGTGHMDQMGWNRRGMFEDGSSRMYGHVGQPGFIGVEGPRDPALPVLFTRNAQGAVTGIVVSFATHCNALENERFYSADIPGEARKALRRLFGDVGVVYLTGAAGDIGTRCLDPHDPEQPWSGEEGVVRSGLYLAGEAAKVIAESVWPMPDPIVRLKHRTLSIPLRPWPAQDAPNYPEPLSKYNWPDAYDYYRAAKGFWPRMSIDDNPVPTRLNVLRLGDAAVCTNPAELFVACGLAIRRASPARVTLIAELTDGYVGYVPSPIAFERGGYETWPAPSSKLAAEAFDMIERATVEMLAAAFA